MKNLNILIFTSLFSILIPLHAAAEGERPVAKESPEQQAVLAVMDNYMRAISARDEQALRKLQTPEGMTYRVKMQPDGRAEVSAKAQAQWAVPATDARRFLERYWNPTVLIHDAIAVVWAPYEFQIDGVVSHCGIDVMDFVKINGEWRVSNAMWTVEASACDAMYPSDRALIRPNFAPH